MSKDYIAIIDGTGPYDDAKYAVEMAGSFCAQLAVRFGAGAQYERGPSFEGYRIRERSRRAINFLLTRPKSDNNRFFIAGYSRGGSAALIAADMLRLRKVPITGLILFDPVNMHLSGSSNGIPSNVEASITFTRLLDAKFIKKYAKSIDDGAAPRFLGSWVDNPLRPGWSENVNIPKGADRGKHPQYQIKGSHGALGGVGWTHVKEDGPAQATVARLTNEALTSWGIKKKITSSKIVASP